MCVSVCVCVLECVYVYLLTLDIVTEQLYRNLDADLNPRGTNVKEKLSVDMKKKP